MYLNTIQPAIGAKKNPRRLGRGIGSGSGKTCGKGHKGQHARAGGYHKLGFEGGQMPLQRRLPKFGFKSKKALFNAEVRLSELNKISENKVSLISLLKENLIPQKTKIVKIILSGEIKKPLIICSDMLMTKGAKEAILSSGGKIES
jgi:large subunit ribosomal protein L15